MEPTGQQDERCGECQSRYYRFASSIAKMVKITEAESCVVVIISEKTNKK